MANSALVASLALLMGLGVSASDVRLINTLDNSTEQIEEFFQSLDTVRENDQVVVLPVRIVGEGLSATFEAIEQPVRLKRATAVRLANLLLNIESYYGGMSACLFSPGMALRFSRGDSPVHALICFDCGELIFENGKGDPLSGRMRLGPVRWDLLDFALEVWPENEKLQMIDRARPPNNALRLTFDPSALLADAKSTDASNATEPGG